MSTDPTRPLHERTPDQIGEYLDGRLISALVAAHHLTANRDDAEDLVRDRLVAISDTWPTREELAGEERRLRMARFREAMKEIGMPPKGE